MTLLDGFRPFFYAVSPNQPVPLPDSYVSAFLLIVAVELLVVAGFRKRPMNVHLIMSSFLVYIFNSVVEFRVFLFPILHEQLFPFRFFKFEDDWRLWILTMFVTDFIYYVFHRIAHKVSLFWKLMHIVHHTPDSLYMVTALYEPATQVFYEPLFYCLMALIGIPRNVAMKHIFMHALSQVWVHTTVIPKLPYPIELILNTPSHHRVHHSKNPAYIDKNFAGIFIIYDRLFGTFQEELDDDPPKFGIAHSSCKYTYNPVKIQLQHSLLLIKGVFVSRVGLLPSRPGYKDNTRDDAEDLALPYSPNIPRRLATPIVCVYVLAQTVILFLTAFNVVNVFPGWSGLAFQIHALWCLGSLLDGDAWSVWTEAVRSLAWIIAALVGFGEAGWMKRLRV
ncbi:MAG: hypothetical protein SGCHY_001354 [Lobulomycetales sp.]